MVERGQYGKELQKKGDASMPYADFPRATRTHRLRERSRSVPARTPEETTLLTKEGTHGTITGWRLASLAAALVAGLGVTDFAQAQAPAETSEKAMMIVTSASLQTQGMALVLANALQQQGVELNILLCDQAGHLAVAGYQSEAELAPKGMRPEGLLKELLANGAQVEVCALYLPNSDYQQEDLQEGVGVAQPPAMAERMRNPDVKVFHF